MSETPDEIQQREQDAEEAERDREESENGDEYDDDDGDYSGYESDEESGEGLVMDPDIVRAAAISAAHSSKAQVQLSHNGNWTAWVTMNDVLGKGWKYPWDLVNPSGIHPKDRNKSIFEYDLSTIPDEEKGWKDPNADIADWFNYGFDEERWESYRKTMLTQIKEQRFNEEISVLTFDLLGGNKQK